MLRPVHLAPPPALLSRPHPTPPPPQVVEQQSFLKGGLGKLAEAATTVDKLSAEAEQQRTVLKAKQAEADEALVHIQDSMLKVGWADA